MLGFLRNIGHAARNNVVGAPDATTHEGDNYCNSTFLCQLSPDKGARISSSSATVYYFVDEDDNDEDDNDDNENYSSLQYTYSSKMKLG